MTDPTAQSDTRPGLAVVAPTQEWYRYALHLRLVREIPEFRLHSIYTHATSDVHRKRRDESDINAVFFDTGESVEHRNRLVNQLRNLRRGNQIFRYFLRNNVKAAIILGYNDIGLVRLFQRCKRAGIRTFLWSDSNIAKDLATGPKKALKRAAIRHVTSLADAVLVCGTAGKRYYLAYDVPASKIIYSPCEPDYALIENMPEHALTQAAATFGVDRSRKRFIACGRLIDIKRYDLAIEAFKAVARDRPGWDFLIVGDGRERPDLESRVPEDLKNRIRFLGYIDDPAAVGALYRLSDVLVHPCVFESWGLIFNEAAAAGLAIVATSSCGAALDLVEADGNGLLVEPGDLTSLTQAMLRASDTGVTERFRARSPLVLERWKQLADPVLGVRTALARAGILPGTPPEPP